MSSNTDSYAVTEEGLDKINKFPFKKEILELS